MSGAGSGHERSSRLPYVLNASVTGAEVVFADLLPGDWVASRYLQKSTVAFALLALGADLNAENISASHAKMALGLALRPLASGHLVTIGLVEVASAAGVLA